MMDHLGRDRMGVQTQKKGGLLVAEEQPKKCFLEGEWLRKAKYQIKCVHIVSKEGQQYLWAILLHCRCEGWAIGVQCIEMRDATEHPRTYRIALYVFVPKCL